MKRIAAGSATSITKTKNLQTLSTVRVVQDYVETGIRILVPVTLMVFVGAIGDSILRMKPWMTLIGLVVGFMLAGLFVKRQAPDTEVISKK